MSDFNVKNLDEFDGDLGRVLILGEPGTGKTTLAGSVAEVGKTLYVYTRGEEGISSLRGEKWSKNIDVLRITDPTTVRDVYHKLLQPGHGYKALVIDSVTGLDVLWKRYLLGLGSDDGMRDPDVETYMEIRDWGRLKEITLDVMMSLYSLASHDMPEPVHVIMTGQVSMYEDEDQQKRVGVDTSSGCRTAIHSPPDFIIQTQIVEDEDDFDAPAYHRVYVGPHDKLVTKTHTSFEDKAKLPASLGTAKQRLTMRKFFTLTGVPTDA